jgi:hypothetical protein
MPSCAIFLKPAVHFGNFYTLDLLRGRIENFSTEAASSGIQAEATALDGSLLEVCVAFMVKKNHRERVWDVTEAFDLEKLGDSSQRTVFFHVFFH